jgi:hypothetical protein
LLLAIPLLIGCDSKPALGPDGLPKDMLVRVDPSDGNIKADKSAEIFVQNSTGKAFLYDWQSAGICKGKLVQKNDDEPFARTYKAGKEGAQCVEEITLTVKGEKDTYTKKLFITVDGKAAYAQLELKPDPIPETWTFLNDYEATLEGKDVVCKRIEKRSKKVEGAPAGSKPEFEEVVEEDPREGITFNLLGGVFGNWGYEFGSCKFGEAPDSDPGVLTVNYDLPQLNSYCGYFEQFKTGEDCEAVPFDISGYEKITFLLKSADDKDHYPVFELVGWDEFAKFRQGSIEKSKPLVARADRWTRYEIEISTLIRDVNVIDPAKVKSIGFSVNRTVVLADGTQVSNGSEGSILVENLALVAKPVQ